MGQESEHGRASRSTRWLTAALTAAVVLALCGCSGPDSRPQGRIVFIGVAEEGHEYSYDLYVVNADGTGRKRLTHDDAVGGPHPGWDLMPLSPPSWSPDGKWIAFENRDTPAGEQGEIAIVRADGTGKRVLIRNGSLPSWSPSGELIAFSRDRHPSSDVWTIRPDGTGARVLVRDALSSAWSPDGSRIAFGRIEEHGSSIFVASADGSDQRGLTTSPQEEIFPAWASRRIAFLRLPYGEPWEAELVAIDPAGTNAQRLAQPGGLVFPAWSPDGSRIVSSDGAGLIVMNADGTGSAHITTDRNDQAPAWEPAHG